MKDFHVVSGTDTLINQPFGTIVRRTVTSTSSSSTNSQPDRRSASGTLRSGTSSQTIRTINQSRPDPSGANNNPARRFFSGIANSINLSSFNLSSFNLSSFNLSSFNLSSINPSRADGSVLSNINPSAAVPPSAPASLAGRIQSIGNTAPAQGSQRNDQAFIDGVQEWADQKDSISDDAPVHTHAASRIIGAYRQGATSLDLSGLGIGSLPSCFNQFAQLESVDLSHNRILFPNDFQGLLTNNGIRNLNISGNELTRLPDLKGMPNLRHLNASHNELTEIDGNIGDLSHLQELDLSHNQLEALPDSICRLGNLQKLNANSNRLQQLPRDYHQIGSTLRNEQARETAEFYRSALCRFQDGNASLFDTLSVVNQYGLSALYNPASFAYHDRPPRYVEVTIDVENNRLGADEVQRITSMPITFFRVYVSVAAMAYDTTTSLNDVMRGWFENAGFPGDFESYCRMTASSPALSSREQGCVRTMFARLRKVPDASGPASEAFAARVCKVALRMEINETVRQQCLVITSDADRNCEDQVLNKFQQMEAACLTNELAGLPLDQQVEHGLAHFRLELVEQFARNLVAQSGRSGNEEVLTHLALKAAVRTPLALPVESFEARYAGRLGGVTQENVRKAMQYVRNNLTEDASRQFLSRFEPIRNTLKRDNAQLFDAIEADAHVELEAATEQFNNSEISITEYNEKFNEIGSAKSAKIEARYLELVSTIPGATASLL